MRAGQTLLGAKVIQSLDFIPSKGKQRFGAVPNGKRSTGMKPAVIHTADY